MFFLGLDIGGTTVKGCVMSDGGRVVYQITIGSVKGDPDALANAIITALSGFRSTISAVGISCAGTVNTRTHLISASNLKWDSVPFEAIMEIKLGCPVIADNDVSGALRAEHAVGVCVNENNVVYIALGTGIGGAFLINGEPYRGSDNTGGEVGHMITHADGLPCACGGRGCFEQYASSSALTKKAGCPAREIFRRVRAGDESMIRILEEYCHELCIGLRSVIHMFRPDMLILGGGVGSAGEALLSRVRQEFERDPAGLRGLAMPRIVTPRLGNSAGSVGACFLAAEAIGVTIRTETFQLP